MRQATHSRRRRVALSPVASDIVDFSRASVYYWTSFPKETTHVSMKDQTYVGKVTVSQCRVGKGVSTAQQTKWRAGMARHSLKSCMGSLTVRAIDRSEPSPTAMWPTSFAIAECRRARTSRKELKHEKVATRASNTLHRHCKRTWERMTHEDEERKRKRKKETIS